MFKLFILLMCGVSLGVINGLPDSHNVYPEIVKLFKDKKYNGAGTVVGNCLITAKHCVLGDAEYYVQDFEGAKYKVVSKKLADADLAIVRLEKKPGRGLTQDKIILEKPKNLDSSKFIIVSHGPIDASQEIPELAHYGFMNYFDSDAEMLLVSEGPAYGTNGDSGGAFYVKDSQKELVSVISAADIHLAKLPLGNGKFNTLRLRLTKGPALFKNKKWVEQALSDLKCY